MNRDIELALMRLSWKLRRRDVPASRRQVIRRDLRTNLREAPASVGAAEAVRRLGDLDVIADEYAAAEARHPGELSMVGGLFWAFATLLLLNLLNGRYITSFNGLKDRASFDPYSYSYGLPGGIHLVRIYGDVERSLLLHIEIAQVSYILFPAIAFVIGLRPWRLLERHTRTGRRDGISAPS